MGKVCAVIPYASRTGTRRNLAELRKHGWNLLVSARGVIRSEGFSYAIDNGAWTSFQKSEPFSEEAFTRAILILGSNAEWIVVPDVVGNRIESLRLTEKWLPRLETHERLLVAVQDGMLCHDVRPWLGRRCGIFLGGSTEWKLRTMKAWGDLSASVGCYFHVARVNSAVRIIKSRRCGAHSIDGSSVSRFSCNAEKLSIAAFGEFPGCEARKDGWFRNAPARDTKQMSLNL